MKNINEKLSILYARRSENEPQDSIETQQKTLKEFAAYNGFGNTLFLSDDGYSGSSFDRSAFQRLLVLVKTGNADTVIVTELYRIGRDITQVREYTDKLFPSCGVRFVALDMPDEDDMAG